ncbi:MAG: chemotaxis protein [Clostridia bacterium]
MQGQNILLESGTNEIEIIEFGIGPNRFGINVIKVREIVKPIAITEVPNSHPYSLGVMRLRNEVLPVISLPKVLGTPSERPFEDGICIVSELNKMKVIFYTEWVSKIHRISWEQISKPSSIFDHKDGLIIGVIQRDDDIIFLLDFEKILVDIMPEMGIRVDEVKRMQKKGQRRDKTLVVVEDSSILRKLLEETLKEAGYHSLRLFTNGKEAWEFLDGLSAEERQKIDLVITDIEMPQMDGLHLTKKIKDNSRLATLPVIIFSSLISDSLRHKGEQVGANAQITKPEIHSLIETVDQFLNVSQ